MSANPHRRPYGWIAVVVSGSLSGLALAQTPDSAIGVLGTAPAVHTQAAVSTGSLALSSWSLAAQDASTEEVAAAPGGSPASFDISYAIYSDYIFRGINRSEYAREGREKPNHQLDVSVNLDLGQVLGQDSGSMGSLTVGSWFEWYAAQKKLDPAKGGQNLQEIDYYLSWSFDVESISSSVSLGYTFYSFPNAKEANTQEWSLGVEHNDAWMWAWAWPDNEDGVLNPTFTFYQDVALGAGSAIWMELGFSHEFYVCPNVTMTPSLTMGIDHNYYHFFAGESGHTTRLATMVWGVDFTYDLTEKLKLSEDMGSASLSWFLYFSDAMGNAEDNGVIQDEFYGGMSLGWSF